MKSVRRPIELTAGLYALTAFLVMIGLVLQLLPSGRPLEARTAANPDSLIPAGVVPRRETVQQRNQGSGSAAAQDPSGAIHQDSEPVGEVPSVESRGRESTAVVTDRLPGTYQAIVALNIFSPDRRPPTTRYVLKERQGEKVERSSRVAVTATPRGPRLFGVTLRASGASALIDADPTFPGAEIYRVGDAVAGGRLIEIGPGSVVIERRGIRQVIRLETARSQIPPSLDPSSDSPAVRKNDER